MRCKYCDTPLSEWEYVWSPDQGEHVEVGRHFNGGCVASTVPDDYDSAWVCLPDEDEQGSSGE